MRKRTKHFTQKLKTLTTNTFNYLLEMETNVFRTYQLAKFGLLITSGAVFLILISKTITPSQWSWYWKLLTAYFIPPAGKETIIPLGINRGIPSFTWFISIVTIDLLISLTIITNWWLIELAISQSKYIKKSYTKLQNRVNRLEQKKYGIFLPIILLIFMFIPFQGSGCISTSILGTLLGFKREHIIIVVLIGSIISTLLITIIYIEGIALWN